MNSYTFTLCFLGSSSVQNDNFQKEILFYRKKGEVATVSTLLRLHPVWNACTLPGFLCFWRHTPPRPRVHCVCTGRSLHHSDQRWGNGWWPCTEFIPCSAGETGKGRPRWNVVQDMLLRERANYRVKLQKSLFIYLFFMGGVGWRGETKPLPSYTSER